MKKQSIPEPYGRLLSLIENTFREKAQGEFAILQPAAKPDLCLCNLYANPLANSDLLYNPLIREGFKFELHSLDGKRAILDTPEDLHDLLTLVNNPSFRINRIYQKTGRLAVVVSENQTVIRMEEDFPTQKEIEKAFKPLKTRPIYITVRDKEIITQKIQKPGVDHKAGNEAQIIRKLKARFIPS